MLAPRRRAMVVVMAKGRRVVERLLYCVQPDLFGGDKVCDRSCSECPAGKRAAQRRPSRRGLPPDRAGEAGLDLSKEHLPT